GQVGLLLLLGTEPEEGHGAQGHPCFQGDGDRGVHPGQFLQGQTQGEVVAAHPAVFLGKRQTEQAHLTHLGDDLVRKGLTLVEVTDDRCDLGTGELLHGSTQVGVLGGQFVTAHGCSSLVGGVEAASDRVSAGPGRGSTVTRGVAMETDVPGHAVTVVTVPSTGAGTECSSFVASATGRVVLAVTCCPTSTGTSRTVPGMGLRTVPSVAVSSARSAAVSGSSRTLQVAPSSPNHRWAVSGSPARTWVSVVLSSMTAGRLPSGGRWAGY